MQIILAMLCVLTCLLCACSQQMGDRSQANLASMKVIAIAMAAHRARTGAYPASLEELVAKSENQMIGPRSVPTDPWGTVYKLKTIDGSPRIVSAGPDATVGTKDDIYWVVEQGAKATR